MGAARLNMIRFLAITCAALVGAGAEAQKPDAADNCVSPAERDRPMMSLSESRRHEIVACANRLAVEQLNSQTPMRIDEITTLESAVAVGTTIIYNSRVDVDAKEVTPEVRAALRLGTRNTVCTTQEMRQTLGYGGTYAYVWVDRDGTFIDRLEIRSC